MQLLAGKISSNKVYIQKTCEVDFEWTNEVQQDNKIRWSPAMVPITSTDHVWKCCLSFHCREKSSNLPKSCDPIFVIVQYWEDNHTWPWQYHCRASYAGIHDRGIPSSWHSFVAAFFRKAIKISAVIQLTADNIFLKFWHFFLVCL